MGNTGDTNEIDLTDIFKSISRGINIFLKWITKLVVLFIFFMVKYFYVYITCLLMYLVTEYVVNQKYNSPVFSSTMVATSNIIANPDIIRIINNLHKTIKEGNFIYIAAELGCSVYDAMQIKDIEALYVIDKNKDGIADFIDYEHKFESKTEKDSNMVAIASEFAIKLDYSNANIIVKAKEGLFNYLHHNKYITDRDTLNRKQLSDLIKKTNNEVLIFDTLQTNYNKFIAKNQYSAQDLKSQLLMVNEKDVKLLYKDAIKLYTEKQALEQRYALSTKEIITVKTDFIPSVTPIGRKSISYLFLLLSPIVMTFMYSLIKNRSQIYRRFLQYKQKYQIN